MILTGVYTAKALSNERWSSAFSLRPVVKLTVNKRLTNTNIRHINPDMTDTYKFILDISLVYGADQRYMTAKR